MTTAAAKLQPYLDALLRENSRINLTGVRDPEQARVLHIEDSLQIGRLGLAPQHCLDLGSGNGFPGVAVSVLFPGAEVFLMERTAKKLAAIGRILESHAVKASGLRLPHLLHLDAAQAPSLRRDLVGYFDLVTARALAPPEQAAALARPFLCEGGSLVLWLAEDAPPPVLEGLGKPALCSYSLPEPAPRSRCLAHYRRQFAS